MTHTLEAVDSCGRVHHFVDLIRQQATLQRSRYMPHVYILHYPGCLGMAVTLRRVRVREPEYGRRLREYVAEASRMLDSW